jgi:hypothetical protein
MTDVVKIAKECRATLVTEITKLDEFLLMAEKLMKFKGLDSRSILDIDDETPTELTNASGVRPIHAGTSGNGTEAKT